MDLSLKQKAFADYYIETGNATESAVRAGYKSNYANTNTPKLLQNTKIKLYIGERLKLIESERIATAEEVMRYLSSVMRGEIEEECIVVEGYGDGCSSAKSIRKEVSPKDRNKAAELLAKRFGLLKENIELSGDLSIKITIEDDGDA